MKYQLSHKEIKKIQEYLIDDIQKINQKNIEQLAQSPYEDLSVILSLEDLENQEINNNLKEKIAAYVLRGKGIIEIDDIEKSQIESLLNISLKKNEWIQKSVKKIEKVDVKILQNYLPQNQEKLLETKKIELDNIQSYFSYMNSISSFEDLNFSKIPSEIIQDINFQEILVEKFPQSLNVLCKGHKEIMLFLYNHKDNIIILSKVWNYLEKNENFLKTEKELKEEQNKYFFELSHMMIRNVEEYKYNQMMNYHQNQNMQEIDSYQIIQKLKLDLKENMKKIHKKVKENQQIIEFYQMNIFQNEKNIHFFIENHKISPKSFLLWNSSIFEKETVWNYIIKNEIDIHKILEKISVNLPENKKKEIFQYILFENMDFVNDIVDIKGELENRILFLTKTSWFNEKDLLEILPYMERRFKQKLNGPSKFHEINHFIIEKLLLEKPILIENEKVLQQFFRFNPLFIFQKLTKEIEKNEDLYIDYLEDLKEKIKNHIISIEESNKYEKIIFTEDFFNQITQTQNAKLLELATSFFSFLQNEHCPKSFRTHIPYLMNAVQNKNYVSENTKEFKKIFQTLFSEEDYKKLFQDLDACNLFDYHGGIVYECLPKELKNNVFITLSYFEKVENKLTNLVVNENRIHEFLETIPKNFFKNPYFVSEAFKINPSILKCVDSSLWENISFIMNILHTIDHSNKPKNLINDLPNNIKMFFEVHKITENYEDSFYSNLLRTQLSEDLKMKKNVLKNTKI